jgi:Flp pilus assembly protein TadD
MRHQSNWPISGIFILLGLAIASLLQTPRLISSYQFQQGLTSYDEGDYQESALAFRQVIQHDSDNADAYYNLGLALSQAGKLDQAIAAYQKSLELTPENPEDIYLSLG